MLESSENGGPTANKRIEDVASRRTPNLDATANQFGRKSGIVVGAPAPLNRNIPDVFFHEHASIEAVEAALREHENEFVLTMGAISSRGFHEGIAAIPNDRASESPSSLLHGESNFPRDPY
jgi:hypothetical protein